MHDGASPERAATVCVCTNLRKAARLVTRRYDEAYAELGLRSTQSPILASLISKGAMTMSQLAADIGLDNSTLSRNFKILERQGLVYRRDRDGRTTEVDATDKGVELMNRVFQRWEKIQAATVAEIGGDDNWTQVLEILGNIAAPERTE